MDMCNKSEMEDLNKTITNAEEIGNDRNCGSPVFKFTNHTKPARGNNLDSSDYDIPSYQINQSVKSRTSSKYGSETNDSVLPFSPILSPIVIAPKPQFQPPSTHTVGTVAKHLDKSCQNKINGRRRPGEVFEGLGMTDKDISWASSMASPPPKHVPGNEFNTIEKATFLPEEKFHNIQPRALFSPPLDDDFGCHPIVFTSESDENEEDEEYKTNIRLSDVCATLNQLEFKSLDQVLDNSLEKTVNEEASISSPVIKTKKKKLGSAKKKKKGFLVISPETKDKYEFSMNLKALDCKGVSCSQSNFIEDDSFQSLSFSSLDELCKTLEPHQNNASVTCADKTLINSSTKKPKQNILKKFYSTKTSTDVYTVSSMDNLHSYIKTLEEGDKCIQGGKKVELSITEKGIVRCDVLTKDSCKIDATKRLHSEVNEENLDVREKKLKKVDDEWENVKQYLSESQLNVSDGEIFRTVENLEKTLASQESKEGGKLSAESVQGEEAVPNSTVLCTDISDKSKEPDIEKPEQGETENAEVLLNISKNQKKVTFTVKTNQVSKAGPHIEECSSKEFSVDSGKNNSGLDSLNFRGKCEGSETILEEEKGKWGGKTWTSEISDLQNYGDKKISFGTSFMEGFSTCSGKKIQISAKALEKAKALMKECNEQLDLMDGFGDACTEQKIPPKTTSKLDVTLKEKCELSTDFTPQFEQTENIVPSEKTKGNTSFFKGFSTGSGKTIQVSAEALEKAKTFMLNCDRDFNENSNKLESLWDGETVNQSLDINARNFIEKEKLPPKGENPESPRPNESMNLPKAEPPLMGFVTAGGNKVTISEVALAKAKQRMEEWEQIKTEDSGNFDCVTENRQKNLLEVKKSEENQSKLSTTSGFDESDEWEEIIPSWLHVYNTSPSIASDRIDLSPIPPHKEGETLKSDREYIVKSPVLGSSDRFQRKSKRKKLQFEDEKKPEKKTEFTVPYKNSYRKKSTKRTLNLSLDFSVPFKKPKFVEEVVDIDMNIKAGRARAREEQERSIREKQKVKILKGSHLSRKCSEKQIGWVEAVKGCSPKMHSNEVLREFGIREAVLEINVETSVSIRLKGEDFFGYDCKTNITGIPVGDDCVLILDDENKFGVEELKRAFLASPGVQPNIVPSGWVENHCKWIIWKLVHYEKSFPQYFVGCLTPDQVLYQLKYRYDREIDRNERSALKKILERDDTSAKRLVLCVCGIKKITTSQAVDYELKLTDGWYSCSARSDPAMMKLIEEGKLCVGTKLLTQGATLVNCEQGVSPLEVPEDVYLKISTNSTRRVRWDTKLGFQKNPKNFPISLGSILPQGGPISRIDVIIVRVYPVLYMEKTSDGHHVTRNRRLEEKADAEYRRIQEQRMESIYNEVQAEMRKSLDKEKSNENLWNQFEQSQDYSQIIESNSNPSALREKLMYSQNDRFSRELREKLDKKLEKEKLNKRNVSEFLRAKIVDFRKPDYNNPAVLSVWNPNEDLIGLLSEGKVVSVMNVTINNSTRIHKPLQINTTRQTQYTRISRNVKYPCRKVTKLKDVSSKVCPAFEEVDIVGMVALIRDISYGSRLSQVVYLTDLETNFVGIVFWGSCKDYGWENVLRISSIVACSNLQWKRNHTFQDVPSLYVNESSVFTENPKHEYLREEIERLKRGKPQDMTDFLAKCEENITAKLEDSKSRFNGSKNSSCNDSTLGDFHPVKSRLINGFESKPTASSTPIKSITVKMNSDEAEPSPIQKRIEKLQSYGEPPPLIPLLIRNNMKRKLRKGGGASMTR